MVLFSFFLRTLSSNANERIRTFSGVASITSFRDWPRTIGARWQVDRPRPTHSIQKAALLYKLAFIKDICFVNSFNNGRYRSENNTSSINSFGVFPILSTKCLKVDADCPDTNWTPERF